jgi:spore coat protein A, manganese oxidase
MSSLSRRNLIRGTVVAGAAARFSAATSDNAVRARQDTATASPVTEVTATSRSPLDPTSIPKFEDPLIIPPVMPQAAIDRRPRGVGDDVDFYEIAVRQFQQSVLPVGMGLQTTVWGYIEASTDETMHSPSFTIEAQWNRPVRVRWVNDLVDEDGRYLPHLLPVDPTLHWANPGGGEEERDHRPEYAEGDIPSPYTGPVPIVVHLHGGATHQESDGYTEAWFLPEAADIPDGFATVGSKYEEMSAIFEERYGSTWSPGSAETHYDNDQSPTTLWFHDHALGITRLNVYAGPAGFYLLRGGENDVPEGMLPGPAPRAGDDPGTSYYEIPLAIQDRSFHADGSLAYPDSRTFFDGFEGPYIPESDVSPIFNPEFFGDTIIVNGHTWPVLDVEPRRYRFRILNGCGSRFLILALSDDPSAPRPLSSSVPFHQIGADGGFLPEPATLDRLLLAPAERADVIVDLTGLAEGTELYLLNEGPDEPFGGGVPGTDFPPANPDTTGQVMKLVVGALTGEDTSVPVDDLVLPAPAKLAGSTLVRRLALLEEDSHVLDGVGPVEAQLGVVDENGTPTALDWDDRITEQVVLNDVEIWEFHNFTMDAHPIHIHEVQFEVVERETFDGEITAPEPWETGRKDTVIAYPDAITRVKVQFLHEGLFVWHCHILEHEDNEMMRPLVVLPANGMENGH